MDIPCVPNSVVETKYVLQENRWTRTFRCELRGENFKTIISIGSFTILRMLPHAWKCWCLCRQFEQGLNVPREPNCHLQPSPASVHSLSCTMRANCIRAFKPRDGRSAFGRERFEDMSPKGLQYSPRTVRVKSLRDCV